MERSFRKAEDDAWDQTLKPDSIGKCLAIIIVLRMYTSRKYYLYFAGFSDTYYKRDFLIAYIPTLV